MAAGLQQRVDCLFWPVPALAGSLIPQQQQHLQLFAELLAQAERTPNEIQLQVRFLRDSELSCARVDQPIEHPLLCRPDADQQDFLEEPGLGLLPDFVLFLEHPPQPADSLPAGEPPHFIRGKQPPVTGELSLERDSAYLLPPDIIPNAAKPLIERDFLGGVQFL